MHLDDLFDDSLWDNCSWNVSFVCEQSSSMVLSMLHCKNSEWFLHQILPSTCFREFWLVLLQVTLDLRSSFDFSVNHLGVILLLVLGPELVLTQLLVPSGFSLYFVMQSSCCLCGVFSALFALLLECLLCCIRDPS